MAQVSSTHLITNWFVHVQTTVDTKWPSCTVQVAGPSIYRTYLAAAQRLGLSDNSSGYWALHITEDERHGRQMVEDVALPLVDR